MIAILLMPTLTCAQGIANMPDISSEGFNLRNIKIPFGRGGTPNNLTMSIESPANWDWTKGLKLEFAIAGGEDGDVRCGIYEAVLTKRPASPTTIPVRLLNPGGLCRPDDMHVYSFETAEERIKAIQSAELAKKKAAEAAEAAEAHRAYLAQLPVLFNGSEQIFVGSDRKCSQQFIEALSMEGLEKRKRIADLVSYGCGFTVPAGTHVKVSQKAASFVEVSIVEGQHNAKSGWVPVGWVK